MLLLYIPVIQDFSYPAEDDSAQTDKDSHDRYAEARVFEPKAKPDQNHYYDCSEDKFLFHDFEFLNVIENAPEVCRITPRLRI